MKLAPSGEEDEDEHGRADGDRSDIRYEEVGLLLLLGRGVDPDDERRSLESHVKHLQASRTQLN